mgnify:CR=1 FL=1
MDIRFLLYDISAEALTRAIDGIHARLNSRVTRGKLTAETCERTLKRLIPVTDIHALAAVNLVIEAASERLEVKKALFAQLAEVCPPQTLLTTNTSSISITAIAAEVKNPERVAGLHFFNPAAGRMKLDGGGAVGWQRRRKLLSSCVN